MPGLKKGQAPKRISDEDKQKIYNMVTVHNKSMQQVAKEMDCARDTVSRVVKDFDKLEDHDRPVDTQDLVKLNRDIYKKIYQLIDGFTDQAMDKSNVYQVAGAISMLMGALKDLTKLTGAQLEELRPEDMDIRGQMDRLDANLRKLNKIQGRLQQEKIRDAERIAAEKGGPKAKA